MTQRYLRLALRLLIFGLCSYGMFYYAYKYYQPQFGGTDYYYYFKMYIDPLEQEVRNPSRARKLSALITHLILRTGFYYPSEIAYGQFLGTQKVFFAALFSNYLALLGTATLCSYTTRERGLVAIMAGVLVMLSFGMQNFVLTGLTEGWSWFLVALGFYFYSRKQFPALWATLLISAFQRETIPVIFGLFALVDWWQLRRGQPDEIKARQLTFIFCLIAFGLYLALRTLDAGTAPPNQQLNPLVMAHKILHFRLTSDWIFQVLLSQNLLILGAVLYFCLRKTNRAIAPYVPHVLLCVAVLIFSGLLTGISNNAGRILFILTPILCPLIAQSLDRLQV